MKTLCLLIPVLKVIVQYSVLRVNIGLQMEEQDIPLLDGKMEVEHYLQKTTFVLDHILIKPTMQNGSLHVGHDIYEQILLEVLLLNMMRFLVILMHDKPISLDMRSINGLVHQRLNQFVDQAIIHVLYDLHTVRLRMVLILMTNGSVIVMMILI